MANIIVDQIAHLSYVGHMNLDAIFAARDALVATDAAERAKPDRNDDIIGQRWHDLLVLLDPFMDAPLPAMEELSEVFYSNSPSGRCNIDDALIGTLSPGAVPLALVRQLLVIHQVSIRKRPVSLVKFTQRYHPLIGRIPAPQQWKK